MNKKILFATYILLLSSIVVSCNDFSTMEESITETEMKLNLELLFVTQQDFNLFLEEFSDNYIEEDYMGLCTYYYKTINGYKTNEYYRVLKDGTIEKNSVFITKEEIEEAEKFVLIESQYKVPEENEFGKFVEIQQEYIDYIKFKGEIIPVKTMFLVYENAKGNRALYTTCINMLDDTLLDYEELWDFANQYSK